MTVELPNEELRLLNRAVDVVVVSVDGNHKSHDSRRGKGSYEKTLKNLRAFLVKKPECSVRLGSILRPMQARGKIGQAVRRLGAELGIPVKIRNFYPIGNAKIIKDITPAEPLWSNFTPEEALLTGNFFAADSCGLGNTLDIRPDGSISPCFALQTLTYKLGETSSNLEGLKNLLEHDQKFKILSQATVDNNPKCSQCVIRYLCHGPCKAWSDDFSKNCVNPAPRSQDCKNLYKKNLQLIQQALKILGIIFLKKMIPEFINYGVNLKTTTKKEDKRLMELIEKIAD